jgi:hypothetical protein
MSFFIWAFIAGTAATYLMDKVGGFAASKNITTGADISHVGRWFLGMLHGRFVHADIAASPPINNEVKAGWYFHYLIGGGAVGLGYPFLFLIPQLHITSNHILAGIAYGIITLVLLWFVMLPAFGWGWFGSRAPGRSNTLLAGILTHLAYGLGIGIVMSVVAGLRLL